jgi:hypothetical protein
VLNKGGWCRIHALADPTYHSNSVEYPPEYRNVHHNNCPNGKQIKPEHRDAGTGGKPAVQALLAHLPTSRRRSAAWRWEPAESL